MDKWDIQGQCVEKTKFFFCQAQARQAERRIQRNHA